jgi:hypothetical protein
MSTPSDFLSLEYWMNRIAKSTFDESYTKYHFFTNNAAQFLFDKKMCLSAGEAKKVIKVLATACEIKTDYTKKGGLKFDSIFHNDPSKPESI